MEDWKLALERDDRESIRALFKAYPRGVELIDEGIFPWGMLALAAAKSVEMAEFLLEQGASIEAVSRWWAPGFGASQVQPEMARYLIKRGATISPHAAAGIGLVEELAALLDGDAELVGAAGGDGCHPLHFALQLDVTQGCA